MTMSTISLALSTISSALLVANKRNKKEAYMFYVRKNVLTLLFVQRSQKLMIEIQDTFVYTIIRCSKLTNWRKIFIIEAPWFQN